VSEELSDAGEPDLRHTRASRLGAAVSGASESGLAARLEGARTQLSVDLAVAGAADVARILVSTLRRQPGAIYVDPYGAGLGSRTEELAKELRELAAAIDPQRPLIIGRGEKPTATVHIGVEERAPLRVIADGHGVRLVRQGELEQSRPPSGLGVVFAAAIAAGEIFKQTAEVYERLRNDHNQLDFCPVTLSDDLDRAPLDLPGTLDLTLVGLGAVGTAIALILSLLHTSGRIVLVDDEPFAEENLGTYSLGQATDAVEGIAKVDLAASELRGFDCYSFRGQVEQAIREIDEGNLPWTRVVMSSLDSVEARHATQLLWPDLLIDSSTGDTAVGVRVCPDGDACLMCLVQESRRETSAITELIELTGLSREELTVGSRLVTDDDVERAKPEIRARMRRAIGGPVCGLGRAIGLAEGGDADYRPSIPFVSQQAACLGVGRLLAQLHGLTGSDVLDANLVQYDTLLGPGGLNIVRLLPRQTCYSVTRRSIIEQVRDQRRRLQR
jgi:hypothetical protein